MNRQTVEKTARKRLPSGAPARGGTNADVGALTRGSTGRPKAERGSSGRSRDRETGHVTQANSTTSTNFPTGPVPRRFLDKLGEMHTGEKELTLAIPLLIKAAKSKDLKELLRVHLKETKGHVKALEQVGKSLGKKLPHKSCKPITHLIKEGVKVIAKRLVSSDQDAALIAVGRKIEQFEMGAYTELVSQARENDWAHEVAKLSSTLTQEQLADELLGALQQSKGPLGKLIKQASLKRVASKPG